MGIKAIARHVAVVLAFHVPGGAAADGAAYRLGSQDKIRVRVTEWRAERGEVIGWDALTGDYTVDGAGHLMLPLVGDIAVAGLTTEELRTRVADLLQKRVGLLQPPDASIEVAEYRPVYVLGQVDKPGPYPYRPDLTVLQAVGLAGGLHRGPELGLQRFTREAITSRGDLKDIALERVALLARRARLDAEARDQTTIAVTSIGEAASPAMKNALREEQVLLDTRRDGLASQIAALNQANDLLNEEIQALKSKIASQERQVALARKDLESVRSLVERGLSVNPRQLALEQTVAQIESARLDSIIALSRARQDISRNERSILDLRTQRRSTVLLDLREVQVRIAKLEERADTARRLLAETETVAPEAAQAARDRAQRTPTFTILRQGSRDEIPVGETDMVLPGDVLKVSPSDQGESIGPETASTHGRPNRESLASAP